MRWGGLTVCATDAMIPCRQTTHIIVNKIRWTGLLLDQKINKYNWISLYSLKTYHMILVFVLEHCSKKPF